MALFAIAFAFFLMSGEAGGSIEDHCTDISYYDVIKYEKSTKQCCDTKLHLVCTNKSDQVCQDVLELQCEVVAWGECISTPTYTPGTKCSVQFNDFAYQNCEEVTASVAHTKKVPQCKQKTKNNCVTDWQVDENGNKVWAGTETCTPVTWEECEIVEKTVTFPTVKTECHVHSHIKWADFIDARTNIVGLESKCELKKAVNCKNIVVNKCAPVVWEDCKMEPREECLAKVIHTPSQEKIHHKKCLTGDGEPVHGGWSEWNNWSVCSAPCGPATRTRQRTCTQPEPAKGGEPCIGDEEQTQDCDLSDCKVSWTVPVLACIWGSNVEIVNDVTLEECQERCDSTTAFHCRSVEWSDSGLFAETCWMSNVTSADTTKYQRPCTGLVSNLYFSERIEDSINPPQAFQNPFVYWSCEFCSEASSALVSYSTSTSFLEDETELLVSKLCPSHPDPKSCRSSLPKFWAEYGKASWSGFWALVCLDQDCSSNDGVPQFWYRVAESKTLATCSDCRERIKTHLDRLDGVTAKNKYERKLPEFCDTREDDEECNEVGEWLAHPDLHTFLILKEEYLQNEDWITDICLDLDCIGPSLRVSENGTLTSSPLSLGSTATVTCQSTGGHPGQILTLSKNKEQLESSEQNQINHTFTVVQDDHEAVFRCEVRDQTRTDPQVVERKLEVHLCSAWTWNEWSKCSQTCGGGHQTRTRTPDKNGIFTGCEVEQLQWCNIEDSPPGNCSEWQWGNWTCSVTCGNGVQIRQREVDTCRKFKGCQVERIQLKECTLDECPIRCDGEKDCCKPSNPCGLDDLDDGDCDKDCCNPSNPCGEDDGHCDEDRDCKPGLVCGDPENPEDNRCRRPKGRCEGIICLHELPTNRRCTEGHGASGKTTTYNWYDDKWPAQGHTARSCKYLCQQDPTCPQADFYDREDDGGDCYVYTTSTGPGVRGCAVVGCVPKEMYFKCEEEQGCDGEKDCCKPSNPCGLDDGHCDEDSDCKPGLICGEANRCTRPEGRLPEEKRSAVTEDQDLYKLVRNKRTVLPNDEKRQPVDSAIELKINIIPYFFTETTDIKTTDEDQLVYREVMGVIEEKTKKCFIFQEEEEYKCDAIRCLEISTKSKPDIESITNYEIQTEGCRGFVAKPKNEVERVVLISYTQTQNCKLNSAQGRAFILHELMHVLGVEHTFTRSDRDVYINVFEDNVNILGLQTLFKTCKEHCPEDDELFRKCKEEHCPHEDISYDCESIMHYGTHANGVRLMEPKEPCELQKVPKCISCGDKLKKEPKEDASTLDWTLLKEMCKIEGPWSPVTCPTGWMKKGTGCYKFVTCPTGWIKKAPGCHKSDSSDVMTEAITCKINDGYLVQNSQKEEVREMYESKGAMWKEGTYFLCEYAGIIQSVRALGGLMQHMSFALHKLRKEGDGSPKYGSPKLTEKETSLIDQMEKVKNYFEETTYLTKSCPDPQNSCEPKEISTFAGDLFSKYEEIRLEDEIGPDFLKSFMEEKEKLQKSILKSEFYPKQEQKPVKACNPPCIEDEECVEDRCLPKCPVTDLEHSRVPTYIKDNCYCGEDGKRGEMEEISLPKRGGGLCPKESEDKKGCQGNICETHYGCMLNVCPYILDTVLPILLG